MLLFSFSSAVVILLVIEVSRPAQQPVVKPNAARKVLEWPIHTFNIRKKALILLCLLRHILAALWLN